MTELQIQSFEELAKFLYNKGKGYISEGNSCDEVLDVLWTIEEFVLSERDFTIITALCEDLADHNEQCKEFGG
jgi:hypothetical protein